MLKIAIDGNEANVSNRVGSNIYAFKLIEEIYKLTAKRKNLDITILLSTPKVADLPPKRKNWRYLVISPRKFWTQWALPIHLFLHKDDYDLLFTPGHYAPRISAVPYVSSIMDLAYIEHPDQFKKNDLIQLRDWTKYSVKNAKKVITISKFSKKEIIKHYQKEGKDISVIYPDAQLTDSANASELKQFFKDHNLKRDYFLYLGTLQPRKNINKLVEAYEKYYRKTAAYNLENKKRYKTKTKKEIPQLVIAGKVGWLADGILDRINSSPFKKNIILTGFVEDKYKAALYKNAQASLLLSAYEGFGIPPLESMYLKTIPIAAKNSSLPEVLGKAGFLVNQNNTQEIAEAMFKVDHLKKKDRTKQKSLMSKQVKKFSWQESAKSLLKKLETWAKEN